MKDNRIKLVSGFPSGYFILAHLNMNNLSSHHNGGTSVSFIYGCVFENREILS